MIVDRRLDINDIIARDIVLGDLAREAEECYDSSLYSAATACLFLLTEHAIKHGVDELEGNYSMMLSKAKENGIISETDFSILDHLRKTRNKLFHEYNYGCALEINDIFYFFSEPGTKKLIYEMYAGKCFEIVRNILWSDSP